MKKDFPVDVFFVMVITAVLFIIKALEIVGSETYMLLSYSTLTLIVVMIITRMYRSLKGKDDK